MDDLLKDVWENHLMFEKIKQHESLIYHKKFSEKFSEKLILMNNCVGHLRNMVRTLNSLDDVGYDIIMSRELESLAKECGLTLAALIENKPLPDSNSLETIVTELDIKLLNLRKEGLIKRFDSKRLVQVFSFYSSILYYAEDIIQGKQDLQAIS